MNTVKISSFPTFSPHNHKNDTGQAQFSAMSVIPNMQISRISDFICLLQVWCFTWQFMSTHNWNENSEKGS